ncbi:unnamed protein product, partial [Onchocerca ochengi]|uniref:DUF5641 domain-containing protein n=1 Tax=Onchocerca ochengi TaxID=42157 RepID=A0A182EZV1_ONCOC
MGQVWMIQPLERWPKEEFGEEIQERICKEIGGEKLLKGEGPRKSWKMGRVEKLIEGKDGLCRSAVVRMLNGIRLIRAIGHLYPLEHCGTESL